MTYVLNFEGFNFAFRVLQKFCWWKLLRACWGKKGLPGAFGAHMEKGRGSKLRFVLQECRKCQFVPIWWWCCRAVRKSLLAICCFWCCMYHISLKPGTCRAWASSVWSLLAVGISSFNYLFTSQTSPVLEWVLLVLVFMSSRCFTLLSVKFQGFGVEGGLNLNRASKRFRKPRPCIHIHCMLSMYPDLRRLVLWD